MNLFIKKINKFLINSLNLSYSFSPERQNPRVIDFWFNILERHFHLRIEPAEFKQDLRRVCNLVDNGQNARQLIDQMYEKWGSDPELIRLDTFNSLDFHSREYEH